jgi:N4-gp56 family major capsid protein
MKDIYVINLQLFANVVQTTLLGDLSAEMKTFYDMTLIDEATANLVHDQFGQKRPIPANGGKNIEFRKFAPLAKATTPLTEGVTPDGKSLAVSTITATVKQYGDYITQSDVLELTSIDNTILEVIKLLGR